VFRGLVDVWQHVLDQAPELRHRITHGRDAKGHAPAARRLEPLEVRDALPRRAVGQPGFQPRFGVVGGIIEVEEFFGIGERLLLVRIDVDVAVENVVEGGHIAAVLAAVLENEVP